MISVISSTDLCWTDPKEFPAHSSLEDCTPPHWDLPKALLCILTITLFTSTLTWDRTTVLLGHWITTGKKSSQTGNTLWTLPSQTLCCSWQLIQGATRNECKPLPAGIHLRWRRPVISALLSTKQQGLVPGILCPEVTREYMTSSCAAENLRGLSTCQLHPVLWCPERPRGLGRQWL